MPHVADVGRLHRAVGLFGGRELRAPVGAHERDLVLLDQIPHPEDRATADDAGQHVDLVLLDQLGSRRYSGGRPVALVGSDDLDGMATQLVAVDGQVELETVTDVGTNRRVRAAQRGQQSDLDRWCAAVLGLVAAADQRNGQRQQGGGDGPPAAG